MAVLPSALTSVTDFQVSQLHLHNVTFYYFSDMLRLLSSSPQRASLCITGETNLWSQFDRTTRPIHQEVHIDTLRGDFFGYVQFCLAVRAAHLLDWPFSVSIGEVRYEDRHGYSIWGGPLEEDQFEDYLANMIESNYHLKAHITQESPFNRNKSMSCAFECTEQLSQ